jgi:hypothetical protein
MNAKFLAVLGLVAALVCPAIAQAQAPEAEESKRPESPADLFADLYEHLADSIIEIRATEDNLVKGLLVHYHAAAQHHLAAAQKPEERAMHLEKAAENIANIANEGDKRVQAVRQRLSEAGHYHQKDTETAEDYMYINSKEKKSLFDLAKKVGQLGNSGAGDVRKAGDELRSLFTKSIGRD